MPAGVYPVTLTGDQSDQWDLLRRLGGGAPAATSVRGTHDEFTVAATPETEFQLTYIPVDGTCAMYVNGLEQREDTDYTVDYDSGLVTFVTALTTGDDIDFRYLITDWLVARSLPPEGGTPPTFAYLAGSEAKNPGNHTSVTSGSFTPTGDALIIVGVKAATVNNVGTPTISDTFGGLTWTRVGNSSQFSSNTGGYEDVELFYAVAPSSPGAGTVTVTWPGTANNFDERMIAAVEATGPGAVGATGKNDNLTGSPVTVTLSGAPASDSGVITIGGADGVTSLTTPTGYTLLHTMNDSVNATVVLAFAALSPGAATTHDWANASAFCVQGCAIEVGAT